VPTGPKGQNRPPHVIGNAVKVMRIATGQETETDPAAGKNPTAVALGKLGGAKGGKARAALREVRRLMDGNPPRYGSGPAHPVLLRLQRSTSVFPN
jgi:hypothetical protein